MHIQEERYRESLTHGMISQSREFFKWTVINYAK